MSDINLSSDWAASILGFALPFFPFVTAFSGGEAPNQICGKFLCATEQNGKTYEHILKDLFDTPSSRTSVTGVRYFLQATKQQNIATKRYILDTSIRFQDGTNKDRQHLRFVGNSDE